MNLTAQRLNQYRTDDIMSYNQERLLLKVYDIAIINCKRHDMIKTNDAIQVLVDALSFETNDTIEVSSGLLRLYLYCQDQMRLKKYSETEAILTSLRDTWINSFEALKNPW